MHLFELGVMRKFLNRLQNNLVRKKMSDLKKNNVSKKLISMRSHVPSEFVRKPRPLTELPHWKATEFRQFLLYTGILALQDEVDDDQYYVFLLIHCAYRLLCNPMQRDSNLRTSQQMLNVFVENFPVIFGDDSVSYNVHSLLHVSENSSIDRRSDCWFRIWI